MTSVAAVTIDDVSSALLLGGGVVDGDLYGHDDPVPNLYRVDRRRDQRTLGLLNQAAAYQNACRTG